MGFLWDLGYFNGILMGFGPFRWDFDGIWAVSMGFLWDLGPFQWDFYGIWAILMGFRWDLGTSYGI